MHCLIWIFPAELVFSQHLNYSFSQCHLYKIPYIEEAIPEILTAKILRIIRACFFWNVHFNI